MNKSVRSHGDLEVYRMGFEAAMRIFELSKAFPVEERYSLTDQMRRSSRSVCGNLAEVSAVNEVNKRIPMSQYIQ